MPYSALSNRGILLIEGDDATTFLNSVITCDVATLAPLTSTYGALLTPQGKIIIDFIIHKMDINSYFFDVEEAHRIDLAKRLSLYKLRSKATLIDVSDKLCIIAGWGEETPSPSAVISSIDPRLESLGWRAVLKRIDLPDTGSLAAYNIHRTKLGVPEGGKDFAFLDAFPHEALMDQLGGVSFNKGCYIGQEVVSRMQHRGQVRTRVMPVTYTDNSLLQPGLPVNMGEKTIGKTGTGIDGYGFATLRLDQVEFALKNGLALATGDHLLSLVKHSWMHFDVPGF